MMSCKIRRALKLAAEALNSGFLSSGVIILAWISTGCEEESWNLVSPPPTGDSVIVRLLNCSSASLACLLELDVGTSVSKSDGVAPLNVSTSIFSPFDSAYVRVRAVTGEILWSSSGRFHFTKRTIETLVLLPSPAGRPYHRAVDTVIRLVTNPTSLPMPGRALIRFLSAVPDTSVVFEVRFGCPSGEYFDRQTFRSSGRYTEIASGELIISCLRGSEPVATIRGRLPERSYSTVIITGTHASGYRFFVLDELNRTRTALQEMQPIPLPERIAQVRWVNISRYRFDSIRIRSAGVIARNGEGLWLSSYRDITACSNVLSDTVELYSNGIVQHIQPISLEIGYRYTLIVHDAPANGAPAARLVTIARDRRHIQADSAQLVVVNALGDGMPLTVLVGARQDERGIYQNGEILAAALPDGSATSGVSITPGPMPLLCRSSLPERLVATGIGTAAGGVQQCLIVTRSPAGEVELYSISEQMQDGAIQSMPAGAYVQVVNALSDRMPMSFTLMGTLHRHGVTLGNVVATVVLPGKHTIRIGSASAEFDCNISHRITILASGVLSSTHLIILDSMSFQPTTFVSRVRCINAAPDISLLRVARTQTGESIAYGIGYGYSSVPFEISRTERINLVFSSITTGEDLLRPVESVSFALGKAYSLVFYGTAQQGYGFFIVQEF